MIFNELTAPEIRILAPETVALFPVGSIEQHGPHLPVSTDIMIASEIAQRVEQALPKSVVLCPALPFGSSHHHLDYSGAMSLSAELYSKVIVELVTSLVTDGFRRIVILNGHGGNITPIRQALSSLSFNLDDRYQPNIALVTYWEIAGNVFSGQPPMESPALSHACEYETSMMLHLSPSTVRMERVERAKRPTKNGYVGWEDDEPYKGVTMIKKTNFISGNGCSGEPQLATAKKGEHLVSHILQSTVQFVDEFSKWPLMKDLRNE